MPDGTLPELSELAQWIRAADDLDEALRTLASSLDRAGLQPLHCALVMIEPDGTFRIAGIWSAMPSQFMEGWIVSAMATPDMRRSADELLKGRPVRIILADETPGLFNDLAAKEGVRGFIVAPVGMPEGVVGVLAVSSASAEAVKRVNLDGFQDLAKRIGRSLIMKA